MGWSTVTWRKGTSGRLAAPAKGPKRKRPGHLDRGWNSGAGEEIRTLDPLVGNEMLYH